MPVSGSKGLRSGILNLPPKVIIHNRDNAMGKYPPILRTGDADNRMPPGQPFNDTETVTFFSASQRPGTDILYPEVLVSGTIFADHTKQFSYVATPNISANLTAPGSLTVGVSDSNIFFDANDYVTFFGKGQQPFNEARIYAQNEGHFYLTGTRVDVLPGFTSPLKSKTSFTVDLPNLVEKTITRSPKERNDVLDPGGEFFGQDLSGFCYYNFVENTWEDIGLTDPATEIPLNLTIL